MKIIKYNLSTIFPGIIIFLPLAFFNGCAGPDGFNRDQLKSFVYDGGNEMKVGHLFFSGSTGLEPTVEFYRNEMINKGWTLINSMASTDTVLNYQKEGWTCTVIIRPRSFSRSSLEILIGPVQVQSK